MTKTYLLATVIGTAIATAAPAQAATIIVTGNGQVVPLELELQDLGDGTYSGGSFDTFRTNRGPAIQYSFLINYGLTAPTDGDGAISFTTTSTAINADSALLEILGGTFNGAPIDIDFTTNSDGSVTYSSSLGFTQATMGQEFVLSLSARVRRGGTLSTSVAYDESAVPEPATWAMMIGGMGVAGGALRRRRAATVTFA